MPPRDAPRPPTLRPLRIIETLARHDVRFVLIGGVAERALGSPRSTVDLDVCPATDKDNLRRLAAALNELEALYRPPGLEAGFAPPEPWNAASFSSFHTLALTTKYGWLDIVFTPTGTKGYGDLAQRASQERLGRASVAIAHIDDLIRTKEAVGTTKYLSHLPLLRELREQLRRA